MLRTYIYDILGRPTARNTARNGQTVNDTFAHNSRSELAEATVSGKEYEYTYDNIGNRQFALEDSKATMYDTNGLNQYTAIAENGAAAFVPQFDADGNQTLTKTSTGIWSIVYNAENRPVTFSNSESNTVVECQYDSQGRRAYKKVTVNGSVTLHQRYIYRGYLQIAACDLTRSGHPCLWLITWDPTQPIATRPLAIRKDGTWFAYGWDLTKNICEVFGPAGYIRTAYTYSPFGQVTASGDVTQPIQWSSEVWDEEPGLVYYNWRYYNATDGRWIRRDFMFQNNLYIYVKSKPIAISDILGLTDNIYWSPYTNMPNYKPNMHNRPKPKNDEKEYYYSVPNESIGNSIVKAYAWVIDAKEVKSQHDLQKAITRITPCISNMVLIAHGEFSEHGCSTLHFGSAEILHEAKGFENLSDFFKQGNFCPNCTLELRACYLGKFQDFKKNLERKTGCKVILHKGPVHAIIG